MSPRPQLKTPSSSLLPTQTPLGKEELGRGKRKGLLLPEEGTEILPSLLDLPPMHPLHQTVIMNMVLS